MQNVTHDEVAGWRRRDPTARTVAMVVLAPTGADRLVVGYGPDPMVGGRPLPRQAEGVEVFLHDPAGAERGGYDFVAPGKAVMTLDRPTGEGVAAVVDARQGFAGLAVFHPSPLGQYREAATLGSIAAAARASAEAFLKVAGSAFAAQNETPGRAPAPAGRRPRASRGTVRWRGHRVRDAAQIVEALLTAQPAEP